MFIFSNLLTALAQAVELILTVYYWLILVRALISWVNPDPWNPIVKFLERATEPVLAPIRRAIPAFNVGIDLSPLIAFMILLFLKSFLVRTLMDLAVRLR